MPARRMPSKRRSMKSDSRSSQPLRSVRWAFRMREHIIGVSVSATTIDTATAPTRVKANSVNSAPVRPDWKLIGT